MRRAGDGVHGAGAGNPEPRSCSRSVGVPIALIGAISFRVMQGSLRYAPIFARAPGPGREFELLCAALGQTFGTDGFFSKSKYFGDMALRAAIGPLTAPESAVPKSA
jgi:hypothetical protein